MAAITLGDLWEERLDGPDRPWPGAAHALSFGLFRSPLHLGAPDRPAAPGEALAAAADDRIVLVGWLGGWRLVAEAPAGRSGLLAWDAAARRALFAAPDGPPSRADLARFLPAAARAFPAFGLPAHACAPLPAEILAVSGEDAAPEVEFAACDGGTAVRGLARLAVRRPPGPDGPFAEVRVLGLGVLE